MFGEKTAVSKPGQQGFQGVTPEVKLKLKLLSISTKLPMYRLLEMMVDNLWEQKKPQMTNLIGSKRAGKEVKRIFEEIKVKIR